MTAITRRKALAVVPVVAATIALPGEGAVHDPTVAIPGLEPPRPPRAVATAAIGVSAV